MGTVPAAQWHHLAATWDGSTVSYYFGGNPVASAAYTNTLFNGSAKLTIGVNSDWNFTAFKGVLDDVRIHDSALDAAQIQAEMNPVPLPGAVWLLGSAVLGLVGSKRRSRG